MTNVPDEALPWLGQIQLCDPVGAVFGTMQWQKPDRAGPPTFWLLWAVLRHGQQYLAEVGPRFNALVSFLNIIEWEHRVDHRFDPAFIQ